MNEMDFNEFVYIPGYDSGGDPIMGYDALSWKEKFDILTQLKQGDSKFQPTLVAAAWGSFSHSPKRLQFTRLWVFNWNPFRVPHGNLETRIFRTLVFYVLMIFKTTMIYCQKNDTLSKQGKDILTYV